MLKSSDCQSGSHFKSNVLFGTAFNHRSLQFTQWKRRRPTYKNSIAQTSYFGTSRVDRKIPQKIEVYKYLDKKLGNRVNQGIAESAGSSVAFAGDQTCD